MQVRKRELPSSFNRLKTYETTFLWCSDGWVYDTAEQKRRQFLIAENDLFTMKEESTTRTAYSDVQYSETVVVSLLSTSPRIWIEQGVDFEHCYEVIA